MLLRHAAPQTHSNPTADIVAAKLASSPAVCGAGGDASSVAGGDMAEENKENELMMEPLEMLYKKQMNITPRKRKSCTPHKKLRRRAGEDIKTIY